MTEPLLILITVILMFVSLPLIVIPAVPVSALEWALVMIFAALNNFSRLTPLAAVIATIFMVLGSTSGFWMPLLGFKGKEVSCIGLIAFFVGMIAGSALIPMPFIGTIIGGIIAVILVEFARIRRFAEALKTGRSALKIMLYSMIAELAFAVAIVATCLISILMTA